MELDDFGRSVLRALVEPVASPSGALQRAVQCYLADRGSGRAAWRYPDFLRHRPTQGDATDLTLEIEDATWSALRTEAEQQRVSIERLLEHAALYFIARLDSLRCRTAEAADRLARWSQETMARARTPRERWACPPGLHPRGSRLRGPPDAHGLILRPHG